jgi:hypothetical protein
VFYSLIADANIGALFVNANPNNKKFK